MSLSGKRPTLNAASVGSHLQQHSGEQYRSAVALPRGHRVTSVKREADLYGKRMKNPRKSQSRRSKPGTLPLRIAFWITMKSKLPSWRRA